MEITPTDIKQQQFNIRFRGFDIREVDTFLEEIEAAFTSLINKTEKLETEIKRMKSDIKDYKEKENTLKEAIINSQQIIDQMKANAEKSAEIIIADAGVKAEKILNRAHNRLSQIHKDIGELKKQRIQVEIQIRSTLESHIKLLEMSIEGSKKIDEEDMSLKVLER